MKQIISMIALMVALWPSRSFAQSLGELINTALEKNYEISITKNEAAIASNNNTMGSAGQLPTVNFNGTYSNSFNNTRQQFADGSIREGNNARNVNGNFSVMARWTLFNGFTVHAKKDQLNYLEELGEQNSRYYIEQTVSDIVTAYYQLVYETQLLEHYRQLLDFSAYRLNIEKRRKEIGAGKLINYGQALVDYQSDSILFLAQQNVIQTLTIEINRVLNNDLERELIVADREITLLDLPPKEEFLAAVDQRNSLLERQRLQELIAETELRMEKAYRYPKVDLFAGYQYNRTFSEVGFFRSNQNFGPTAGLTVSFNLYNGGNTTRAIKNTEIYRENTRLSK
ncbi:MAG: TolC family protein, partial [Cyclobacteriaceae bacterium]|nr:TolC family protein [Cyclobacteriaceae bacterium]